MKPMDIKYLHGLHSNFWHPQNKDKAIGDSRILIDALFDVSFKNYSNYN